MVFRLSLKPFYVPDGVKIIVGFGGITGFPLTHFVNFMWDFSLSKASFMYSGFKARLITLAAMLEKAI